MSISQTNTQTNRLKRDPSRNSSLGATLPRETGIKSPCRWLCLTGAAWLLLISPQHLMAQRAVAVKGFDGRLVEEEVDDEEVAEEEVVVEQVFFPPVRVQANVEIDENDPFAQILKQQPGFAEQVRMCKSQIESQFGVDLTFAARSFEADEQQRLKMKQLAQEEIKKQYVSAAKAMNVQFLGIGRLNAQKQVRPEELRRNCVKRIVRGVFVDGKDDPSKQVVENYKKWRTECEARAAYKNTANATIAVNTLDKRLFFSATQHEKLVESVASVWEEDWDYYIQLMPHNPQFFPPLPDKCLKPWLEEHQMVAWKNLNYQHTSGMGWQFNGGGFFGMNQNQQKNFWFDDPEEGQ